MNRPMAILLAVTLLTLCRLPGKAQQFATPPSGIPQEKWELTYDDYRAPIYDSHMWVSLGFMTSDYPQIPPHDKLINLKKEVLMARDGNEVYIKGIFKMYPDAWIRCEVSGNNLIVYNNQALKANGNMCFHAGYADYLAGNDGDRDNEDTITFTHKKDSISFDISVDGNTITSPRGEYATPAPAFWFDKNVDIELIFDYNQRNPRGGNTYYTGSGYPDVEYMVNMVFRKI